MSLSQNQDAIDLLIADHQRVAKLFKEFDKLKNGGAEEELALVVESACAELKLHSLLELEIFYPAVRSRADGALLEQLQEADVEHDTVEGLIDKITALEPEDPMYKAHFSVLAEYVEHHVKEEEKQMFPLVRKLKDLDLGELGDEMQARKEDLLDELGEIDEEFEEDDAAYARNGSASEHRRSRTTN
ncbi:MAG TPA: hemerythrin domain-containing protein [Burkholderiales bacterium]|nr:hemerythrin domain-containing protein [Burkholderiales bacterium]